MECDGRSEGEQCMFDIESEGEKECGWKWEVLCEIREGKEEERERDCIVLEVNVVDEGEMRREENECDGEDAWIRGMRGGSGCVSAGGVKEDRVCEEDC